MSEDRIIRGATIRGHVQGVGFRMWTEREARVRRLEGWVRNRRDGSVEGMFAGPAAAVAGMIAAVRRGPPGAHVEAVDVREAGAAELGARRPGETFSQLPTV
jgi:acylphosphatase